MNEQIDKEKRQVEYDKFYQENNLDKVKILEDNKIEDDPKEGYLCICCFCRNNNNKCSHICCKEGVKCEDFRMNIKFRNKYTIKEVKI